MADGNSERLYSAGLAARNAGDLEAAGYFFCQAIAHDPGNARAHLDLARALVADGQTKQAAVLIARARELAPDDETIAIAFASYLDADRQTDRAWEMVERFLKAGNQSTQIAVLYARMAPALHAEDDALAFISRVLGNPQPRPARELASLHFSAATLLDKMERYDDAFAHALIANNAGGFRYNPRQVECAIDEAILYFDRPTLRRLPRATHGSELPVFIVGMPRSGTTLIEQILSSHPAVHGGGELRWLFRVCESLVRRCHAATPALGDSFDRLSMNDADALADEYLQPLSALNPGAARIINKLPTNFMHLGLIALLFPQARVIYCRRDPRDTCLSCFMTDFADGHDFSTTLAGSGHYFRQHELIMDHWKRVLDLPILDVRYEDVVDDLPGQTRRMLDFLDVPWDPGCLHFTENRRFVATASNQQVRRPIYQNSVGRWRHYDRHLGPLHAALTGAGS
ncbi:MAG TPA: sulfotransferase [Tepidisphaeraceae bacterium]|jgi:tetratricopeptide (TPR) repeat protein|nr:sulfotransferase [Tepidisphaeraceae bacterium]